MKQKIKFLFLLAVISVLSAKGLPAQTTQGTDFWVSFGANSGYTVNNVDLKIKVAATEATVVDFIFTADVTLSQTVSIGAGEVYTFDLTKVTGMRAAVYYTDLSSYPMKTSGVSSKSLQIKSDKPVTAYAYNKAIGNTSADATNLLPTNALGKDYFHISYEALRYDGYTIVATEDDTDIYRDGNTTPVNSAPLKKGEVYSFYAQRPDTLTGKHITANHPIAYFVTNTVANTTSATSETDNLFQQMMPVNTWGKEFFVPATLRGKDRMRVVAAYDNTKVNQTGATKGASSVILNKGQFYEWEVSWVKNATTGGCFLSADKPVGVSSYLVGQNYASLNTSYQNGDPAMALVTPMEQWVDQATIAPFVLTGTQNISAHHILIVTPTATRDKTTLSIGGTSTALSGWWVEIANSIYSYYILYNVNESAKAYTIANPAGLTATVYGVGNEESYFYPAISATRDLSTAFYINDIHHLDLHRQSSCGVSEYRLKANLKNVSATATSGYLKWFVDDVESTNARDLEEWTLNLKPNSVHTIRMEVLEKDGVTRSYSCTIPLCDLLKAGGTDFWIAFGDNAYTASDNLNLQVRVTATEAAVLTLTFTKIQGAGHTLTKSLAEGEVYTLELSKEQRANTHSPDSDYGIDSKSLRIESSTPVRVQALNQRKTSTDATNILPVRALGTEYYLISYESTYMNSDGIIIVATKNGTDIFENGAKLNATPLSAGQIWVNYTAKGATQNGRHITSNLPVACFVANGGTVPATNNGSSTTDNLFQQMMPVHLWGKNYCVPVTNPGMERIRIFASQNNTSITLTGGKIISGTTNLNKGQFVELQVLKSTGGCFISANKPVGVCTFMPTQGGDGITTSGDASMAWVPPVEQFIPEVTIQPFTSASTTIDTHYALIVAPTSDIAQTTLYVGGVFTAFNGTWTSIPGSRYSFCTQTLTTANAAKPHVFSNPKGLLVYGYGTGPNESYYYLAASSLKNLRLRIPVNPPKIRLM